MNVFEHITTTRALGGGIEISWVLNRQFNGEAPYTYLIEVQKGGDDWEEVATVAEVLSIQDTEIRKYIPSQPVYYRITLIDANDETYTCNPFIVNRYGSRTQIADELMRKERLSIENLSGRAGLLYKRKWYGTDCTACRSPDTDVVVDAKCSICYGTGKVGGYFTPELYYIAFRDRAPREKKISEVGNVTTIITAARGIAYPWVESGDVWVDQISNQRYFVNKVKDVQFKQVPYAFNIELREAPQSDVVYTLDTDGLYKVIDGSLYLYDLESGVYNLVALDSGAIVVATEYPDMYRVSQGKIWLYDITLGGYSPIALSGGALVVLEGEPCLPTPPSRFGIYGVVNIGALDHSITVDLSGESVPADPAAFGCVNLPTGATFGLYVTGYEFVGDTVVYQLSGAPGVEGYRLSWLVQPA